MRLVLWTRSCLRRPGRHDCLARATARRLSSTSFEPVARVERVERVELACRSSGSITIDLHGLSQEQPSSAPFVIHLPPFATSLESPPHLPDFLSRFPTAVVNYRWSGPSYEPGASGNPRDAVRSWEELSSVRSESDEDLDLELDQARDRNFVTPLRWPTPLHDVLFAYSWLVENLPRPASSGFARRDIYVHGSYLGATLAAALALTESHAHERTAVRGFAAYNGIYNWTMFLPDHKINQPAKSKSKAKPAASSGVLPLASQLQSPTPTLPPEGSALRLLREEMPTLFGSPADLFDAFASPCLLFQTAGMLVPRDFDFGRTAAVTALVDRMAGLGISGGPGAAADLLSPGLGAGAGAGGVKVPRRSALTFPPRKSTLKIPHALLLHDTAELPPAPTSKKGSAADGKGGRPRTRRPRKAKGNHFEAQAEELAGLMRRSVERLEVKERMQWDEDFEDWEGLVEDRVRMENLGYGADTAGGMEMKERGGDAVRQWLEERMS